MKEIIEVLKKVILRLCSYIFFSLVLFIVSYSLMTKEFPPNITNMRRGIQNVSQLAETFKAIQSSHVLQASAVNTNDSVTAIGSQQDLDVITESKQETIILKQQLARFEIINNRLIERVNKLESEVSELKQKK
jgi:hypothetical protein